MQLKLKFTNTTESHYAVGRIRQIRLELVQPLSTWSYRSLCEFFEYYSNCDGDGQTKRKFFRISNSFFGFGLFVGRCNYLGGAYDKGQWEFFTSCYRYTPVWMRPWVSWSVGWCKDRGTKGGTVHRLGNLAVCRHAAKPVYPDPGFDVEAYNAMMDTANDPDYEAYVQDMADKADDSHDCWW